MQMNTPLMMMMSPSQRVCDGLWMIFRESINYHLPPPPQPHSPNDSLNWSEVTSQADSEEDFLKSEEALNYREGQILNSVAKLGRILFQLLKILNEILSDCLLQNMTTPLLTYPL